MRNLYTSSSIISGRKGELTKIIAEINYLNGQRLLQSDRFHVDRIDDDGWDVVSWGSQYTAVKNW